MKKLIVVPVVAVIAAVDAASAAGFVDGVSAGPLQVGQTNDLECANKAEVAEWGYDDGRIVASTPSVTNVRVKLTGSNCGGQSLETPMTGRARSPVGAGPARAPGQAVPTQLPGSPKVDLGHCGDLACGAVEPSAGPGAPRRRQGRARERTSQKVTLPANRARVPARPSPAAEPPQVSRGADLPDTRCSPSGGGARSPFVSWRDES